MLQDPEGPYEEWALEVWAENLEAARSVCEQIISQNELTEVQNVTQSRKKPSKVGNYLFVCWFRTEISTDDNSNNK